ncbi:hypothetical protein PFISCL1PPCAC_8291 [Pristionchus fissidentatus]|uniref:COX assembly mitochondrial protein n=1 Tax=Pristionchus fissidentatus TaxID=1538716 RepID=A0AAV5VEW2_9BILA|nr:hypothetical protein PFISCL1PPCAC_8291 [Pristionchus fissidentatus]
MSERHMPSIFPECDQFKQLYDKCFTDFFQKFITPNFRHQYAVNPCERLHEVYRECVQEGLQKKRPFDIDLDEVRKEVLNTDSDKLKTVQEEKERQSK